MPRKYMVIARGSRLNYTLNFDDVHSFDGVRQTLQEIIDDLPKPKHNPKIKAYVNEESINIILEEDAHIDER